MARKLTVKKIGDFSTAIFWQADMPNGAKYRVTTYTDNSLVFVQTWAKMHQCKNPQIVASIEHAMSAIALEQAT